MAQVGRMVKEGTVQEIAAQLSERPNFFITSLNRLAAPDADTLRRQLFGSRAQLVMVKRKLGRRAIDSLNLAGLPELLQGSVGLVLADADIPATAKLLVEFRKSHEDQLTLRGAVVDGQLLDASRVEQLAQLPPKPVLLAQVVATIESPIADVIFTLERLIGDIAWLAEQAASQKSQAAPAPAEPGTPPQAGSATGVPTPKAEGPSLETPPTLQEGTPS